MKTIPKIEEEEEVDDGAYLKLLNKKRDNLNYYFE